MRYKCDWDKSNYRIPYCPISKPVHRVQYAKVGSSSIIDKRKLLGIREAKRGIQ
jgi:hypothetical protein